MEDQAGDVERGAETGDLRDSRVVHLTTQEHSRENVEHLTKQCT